MAHKSANLVQDTSTTTGTGTLTLSGTAPTGFQNFSAGIGDGNTCIYSIRHASNGEWEVGIGTYTHSGVTLARTTVLASSNSGSAVNFSSGTKYVRVVDAAGIPDRRRLRTDFTAYGTLLSGLGPNELPYDGSLTTWTAFSGASPTQATSANRPRVAPNAINGFPAVIFTPANAGYLSWSSGALNLTSNQFTVFCVARRSRQRVSENYGDPIVYPASNDGWNIGLQNLTTEVLHISKRGVSAAGNLAPCAFDTWRSYMWRLEGTNGIGKVDGNTAVSAAYAPTFTGSMVHHLGWDTGSIYFGGAIALLLIYDGDIGTTNIAAIENAIRDEFGIG